MTLALERPSTLNTSVFLSTIFLERQNHPEAVRRQTNWVFVSLTHDEDMSSFRPSNISMEESYFRSRTDKLSTLVYGRKWTLSAEWMLMRYVSHQEACPGSGT